MKPELLSRIEVPQSVPASFDTLRSAIEESLPGGSRHVRSLPADIRSLWKGLTSERDTRKSGYLSEDASLNAYVRYFLPWNVLRLSAIFASGDFDGMAPESILDFGSGPLTLPIALFLARPELRQKPIEISCVDISRKALDAGIRILEALAVKLDSKVLAWKVKVIRCSVFEYRGTPVDLVTSANVFNEHFWAGRQAVPEKARQLVATLSSYAKPDGRIFMMEPGDPRSGAMLAALRDAFIQSGMDPIAPCPHSFACPMPGFYRTAADYEEDRDEAPVRGRGPRPGRKRPWCHMSWQPGKTPRWLDLLSKDAGLPKEKLVASWLYVGPEAEPDDDERDTSFPVRIISDEFMVRNGVGRYACSCKGYSLVRYYREDQYRSGDLAMLPYVRGERDSVSGASLFEG